MEIYLVARPRRLHAPLVFLCHGGPSIHGQFFHGISRRNLKRLEIPKADPILRLRFRFVLDGGDEGYTSRVYRLRIAVQTPGTAMRGFPVSWRVAKIYNLVQLVPLYQ